MSRSSETAAGFTEISGVVYGIGVHGRLPAGFGRYLRPLPEGTLQPPLSLEASFDPYRPRPRADPIWTAPPEGPGGAHLALYREPGTLLLTLDGDARGCFRIGRRSIAIEWPARAGGAEHAFFSYALPLWLETRGVPVLHASAVGNEERAVAFVGPSGFGKSTLCAELVRSGFRFVADDGLPLQADQHGDWRCNSGPPWLRLWPSALENLLGIAVEDLPRVQESIDKRLMRCSEESLADVCFAPRLAAVCVLDVPVEPGMRGAEAACKPSEALIRLVEHSLAAAPVAALGLAPRRLDQLSRLVARTPVRYLRHATRGGRSRLARQAVARYLTASRQS